MCGIVGYIGTGNALEILIEGLEKLEYRGYDSAGVATVVDGQIKVIKAKGKLYNLRSKLEKEKSNSTIGIGHTRWATHGKPEEYNAHPHCDDKGKIAVVQNGIIENFQQLKEELTEKGHQFVSDTDTEVIPHLIAEYYCPDNNEPFLEAVIKAVNRLHGAFAIAILHAAHPDELIVARQSAPLLSVLDWGNFSVPPT